MSGSVHKYRVRLEAGRIVGPFDMSQMAQLYKLGHLTPQAQYQYFPTGDWEQVTTFTELVELFKQIDSGITPDLADSKTLVKIKMMNQDVIENGPKEFKYSKQDEGIKIDYEQLEKKYQEKEKEKADIVAEENKTVIRKKTEDFEKTRINPFKISIPIKEATKVEQPILKESLFEENELTPSIEPQNEKTEVVKIDDYLNQIQREVVRTEADEEQAKVGIAVKAVVKEEPVQIEEEPIKKKKMKPIIALVMIVIIGFLLFDEEEKVINPVNAKISFPVALEYENKEIAEKFYNEGMEVYKKNTYESKILAARDFLESLQNQFKENPAMGMLIKTDSEIFPNVDDRAAAINNLYKLIELSRGKMLTEINVAYGAALFYEKLNRPEMALNIIENFTRLSSPTPQLFSLYLKVLLRLGKLEQARKVYDKLKPLKELPVEGHIVMASFLSGDQKTEEAFKQIKDGLENNPKSVPLMLEYVQYLFDLQKHSDVKPALKKIEKLYAENNPQYYAKFLEYMGMTAVISKQFDVGAKLFGLSLKIVDSEDLRAKLAALNTGGDAFSGRLIIESKIKNSISLALKAASEEKWEDALRYGIDATDLDERNIQSHTTLAEIQLRRGYVQSAVNTIKKIRLTNPKDTRILPMLVDVYLKAFMFDDVKMEMSQISSPAFVGSFEYAKFMARYYEATGNNLLALRWYSETVNRYPIDDDSYFSIARIYLTGRKYANCKQLVSKAIQLNPNELNYHLLYANVLYEIDSVDTAIGYLRNLEKDFPESNRLTSNIAIFYYKSGQQKEFEKYREQLFKLPNIDPAFFKFLTEEAMKMDKDEDVNKYSLEYLKMATQDFEMRMKLAKYFFDKSQFPATLSHLEEILSKLPSYPNLHSLFAETYFKQNDLVKAKTAAEEEIKLNPSNDVGFVMYAKVFMAEKNYIETTKNAEKALRINSKNVEGLLLLGKVKMLQNYNEQAKSMFEKAQKIEQNNPEVHRELGNVYRAIGQSTLAIESFKVYLDLKPDASDRAQIEQIMNMLK